MSVQESTHIRYHCVLPNHQADGIAKVMKKPMDNKSHSFRLQGLDTDRLAFIICKPKLLSPKSQQRSCIGTNYMLKGEPIVVYEELTLQETPGPIEARPFPVYLSQDTTKGLIFRLNRSSFYSFPISVSPETIMPSSTGAVNFTIEGSINGLLTKQAGIKVWSCNFTVEPESTGKCPSPRIIIGITDLSKFMNSKLWRDGYMYLGQAKRLYNVIQTPSELNSKIFEHSEIMEIRKIQAYRIMESPRLFNSESKLLDAVRGPEADAINQHYEKQKEERLTSAEKLSIKVVKERELVQKRTTGWENDKNEKALESQSSYELEAVEEDEPDVVGTVPREELVRMSGSKRKREPDDDDLIDDGDLYR